MRRSARRQLLIDPLPIGDRRQDGGMPRLEEGKELAPVRADIGNGISVEMSASARIENHDKSS